MAVIIADDVKTPSDEDVSMTSRDEDVLEVDDDDAKSSHDDDDDYYTYDDYEEDDDDATDDDVYKRQPESRSYYPEPDHYPEDHHHEPQYYYQPTYRKKKKKVYVPVFVPEKDKKKSKFIFLGWIINLHKIYLFKNITIHIMRQYT